MRRLVPVLLLTLLVLAAACGGGGDDGASTIAHASAIAHGDRARAPRTATRNADAERAAGYAATPRSTQQPIFVTPTHRADAHADARTQTRSSTSRWATRCRTGNGASDRDSDGLGAAGRRQLGAGLELLEPGRRPATPAASCSTTGSWTPRVVADQRAQERRHPRQRGGRDHAGDRRQRPAGHLLRSRRCRAPARASRSRCRSRSAWTACATRSTTSRRTWYAIDRLQEAAPGVPIFLMTLYNPFSGGSVNLDGIGALALEGQDGTPFPTGLNDAIRAVAQEKGVVPGRVVRAVPRQGERVHLAGPDPPQRHRPPVMAQAVLAAMAQAGVP